jgi:hypothetical protein
LIDAPHPPQKRASLAFSAPQLGQNITNPLFFQIKAHNISGYAIDKNEETNGQLNDILHLKLSRIRLSGAFLSQAKLVLELL